MDLSQKSGMDPEIVLIWMGKMMINRGNLGCHMLENSQKNRHMLLSMAADFLGEKLEGQVN